MFGMSEMDMRERPENHSSISLIGSTLQAYSSLIRWLTKKLNKIILKLKDFFFDTREAVKPNYTRTLQLK
jgi:hypothetical protein